MAFPLRKSSDRGTVGLDIDGRYLAAAQVSAGRITRAASQGLPEGLVRDGEVSDPEALAQHLKSFAAATGLPKSVRLGVANQQIVVRVVELPRIEDERQRDAAVRFQASEAIAMPLDEAVLDHQVASFTTGPDGTPRMQVVLVAARRKMIETLLEAVKAAGPHSMTATLPGAVKAAGLRAEGIGLDGSALVRALAAPEGDEPDETARV